MRDLRLSICFEDELGNVVSKRLIESSWSVNDEEILQMKFNVCMKDEVANILCETLKNNLTPDIIKEMINELGEK